MWTLVSDLYNKKRNAMKVSFRLLLPAPLCRSSLSLMRTKTSLLR